MPQPPIEIYGKLRRRKHLNETDVLAVVVVFLGLIAATGYTTRGKTGTET